MHYIHNINPILLHIGPLSIRWYGLMYLIGFTMGYLLLCRRHRQGLWALPPLLTQDLITYLLVGMLFGARIVYVLIYNPEILDEGFLNIIAVWKGGLSYHGAGIGFVIAMLLFARKHKISFFHISDNVVFGAAQGVFWGRLGNFANGELYGRVTDVPWGVVFPGAGTQPRHPSQLYQSLCEGLLVFLILQVLQKLEIKRGFAPDPKDTSSKQKKKIWKRTGVLGGSYLILYGLARFSIEFFREPDAQMGYYFSWLTMGQILCFLMISIGTIVLVYRIKNPLSVEYKVN